MNQLDAPWIAPWSIRTAWIDGIQRLAADQRGALASVEMILMGTIVMLGMIVGLSTWRDAVVQELGDSAAAVSELNQGYRYDRNTISKYYRTDDGGYVRVYATVDGSTYIDRRDFCQATVTDPSGQPAMCITLTGSPLNER